MDNDVFISLNDSDCLFLYRHQGLIQTHDSAVKINKDIASILQLCFEGKTLYNAIIEHFNQEEERKKILALSGIMQLVEKKVLLATPHFIDCKNKVIDERNVFYPRSMHIELTAKCNLNCYYCYRESDINVSENRIKTQDLLNTINFLSDRGLSVVELTGGEPLMHPDFEEILDYCSEKVEIISVITNGTLMTPKIINKIASKKNKVFVSISLDNYREEEHDKRSRVNGSFAKAVDAIRQLSKQGIIVRAAMAVDENSWHDIEKTLLFAKEIGATKFTYSPVMPFGRASENFKLWNNVNGFEIIDLEKKLIAKYGDFLHVMERESVSSLMTNGGCGAGSRNFALDPYGNVRICTTFDSKKIIGNIITQNPKDIFSSDICRLMSEIKPPTITDCQDCRFAMFCTGCVLRAMKAAGIVGVDSCRWLKNRINMDLYNIFNK